MEDDQDLDHKHSVEVEMEEAVTPTNEDIISWGSKLSTEKALRICVSPTKNSGTSTSGDTTPDAALLNKSPFEVKLKPKLLRKKQSSPAGPGSGSSEEEVLKTPEKTERPINFKSLSPRSVTYEFSSRYPSSKICRPRKVRRSFNKLWQKYPSDPCCSKSLAEGRSKSGDAMDTTDTSEDKMDSIRKKKHFRSVSSPNIVTLEGRASQIASLVKGRASEIKSFIRNEIEVEKLVAKMDPMNISPEDE